MWLSELQTPDPQMAARIKKMTEAEIVTNARSDPDNPPLTTAQLRTARPPIPHPNVRRIRKSLKLTQSGFAFRFGFDVTALRDWEQGRRNPDRAARILLSVIEHEPKAVDRALRASVAKKRGK
jgi:putative transcriptional regulator